MNCYANDEPTIAALNASGQTFEEALSTFTVSTHKALENLGKTPVVWEGKLKPESCLPIRTYDAIQRWSSLTT